jgi:hypothetical protein
MLKNKILTKLILSSFNVNPNFSVIFLLLRSILMKIVVLFHFIYFIFNTHFSIVKILCFQLRTELSPEQFKQTNENKNQDGSDKSMNQ